MKYWCALFCSFFCVVQASNYQNGLTLNSFGDASITRKCFDYIRSVVPEGATVVEFGSGWASGQLSEYYTVYSVEHDKRWLNQYKTNYVYAPIVDGWYNKESLDIQLPKEYALLLIDGPPAYIGRFGILDYLKQMNVEQAIIIVDDVHRAKDYDLMLNIAELLNREYAVYSDHNKQFGVLLPK